MFEIDIDGSYVTEANLLREGPTIRTDVTVTAAGVPITGPPDNPSQDEFVPDLCFKLLRSISDIIDSRTHDVSFNSSVCEITYEPATEETVFVHAYHVTGERLNDEVSEPGVEVPISSVVEEHLRVCEECYRITRTFRPRSADIRGFGASAIKFSRDSGAWKAESDESGPNYPFATLPLERTRTASR